MRVSPKIISTTLHIPDAYRDQPPSGWSWMRLDKVCVGIFDCPHSTPKLTTEGPYVVRTQDIATGFFRPEHAAHVSNSTYVERIARVVPSYGDLLYSREGTYFGIAAEVPDHTKLCLGQRMVLVRPDSTQLDSRYLRHWLNSPLMAAHINGFRDGSVAERLNLPTIRGLPILVPPRNDQRAIAQSLETLENKVDANRRIITTSLSILDNLLGLRTLEPVPLRELVDTSKATFTPNAFGSKPIDHYSIPAFDAGQLPDRVIATTIMSNKLIVDRPSILVSRLNPRINRSWFVVPEQNIPAGCSTEFMVLHPKKGVTLGSLWLAVRSEQFTSELVRRSTGTSGSHQRVRPQDAVNIEVPDVRGLDQNQMAEADQLLLLAHQRRIESRILIVLRDTLLPELLSGRLHAPQTHEAAEAAV